MLRIVAVSVRGPRYLVGNPSVHPIDEVPPNVGTPFATVADVQAYVTREFQGLTVYWRVEVVDTDATIIWRGTRDGHRWIWQAAR